MKLIEVKDKRNKIIILRNVVNKHSDGRRINYSQEIVNHKKNINRFLHIFLQIIMVKLLS